MGLTPVPRMGSENRQYAAKRPRNSPDNRDCRDGRPAARKVSLPSKEVRFAKERARGVARAAEACRKSTVAAARPRMTGRVGWGRGQRFGGTAEIAGRQEGLADPRGHNRMLPAFLNLDFEAADNFGHLFGTAQGSLALPQAHRLAYLPLLPLTGGGKQLDVEKLGKIREKPFLALQPVFRAVGERVGQTLQQSLVNEIEKMAARIEIETQITIVRVPIPLFQIAVAVVPLPVNGRKEFEKPFPEFRC